MPFNGVGVFQRVYQWVNDAANGIFVDATRTDTDSNDIATGLTNCVTRDGQSPWLANLPAAGFKITGLGAGNSTNDSVNYGQVFVNPTFAGMTATGVVNFSGATSVSVPTVTTSDNSTNAASTAFVTQKAFQAALPAQAGNTGKYITTDGTSASWSDTFTIPITFNSRLNEAKGADIASSSTINLTTATGNLVHVTGTTTITAITIPSGAERTIVFDGVLTLTHNATTLILPGAANITTAAGDSMIVRGDGSGNARVISYTRANGFSAVMPGYVLLSTITPTAVSNIDALNVFTSQYDDYMIIMDGIKPNANDSLKFRFANAGVVDSGSKYYSNNFGTNSSSVVTQGDAGAQTIDSTGKGGNGTINVRNANDATNLKTLDGLWTGQVVPTTFGNALGRWNAYDSANAISGIRFFWNSGSNFQASGKIRIYGIINS